MNSMTNGRRAKWQKVLDMEVARWSTMSKEEQAIELREARAYQVELDSKQYQVEVQLLENTGNYVHVSVSVDDGSLPQSIVPLTHSFIKQSTRIDQGNGIPEQRMEDFEEIAISLNAVVGPFPKVLNVPKLLLALGMAESGVDAMRALAEKAVTLNGEHPHITEKFPPLPTRIVVRVSGRIKVAVIDEKFEGEKTAERVRPVPRLRDKTSNPGGTPAPVTA